MDTTFKPLDTVREASAAPGELIHSLLDGALTEVPDDVAVRDSQGHWTYRQLAEHSHRFAHWLRAHGVGHGDRIVVQLPSTRELVAMFFGAARAGVVFVPLNPAMKPFLMKSVLDNSEPRLIIGKGVAVEAVREVTATVPVHDFDAIWSDVQEQDAAPIAHVVEPTDLAVLIYTSGSTSAPKAVMCPHSQVVFATRGLVTALGYRSDDIVFCRFPLSWDYGLYKVLMTAASRCEIVLAGEESDLALLRRMRETGATVVPIVPSLASMIVSLASRDNEVPPPVRMFTNTGAALPQATIDGLRENFPGVKVVRQFGQTECKRITVMPPDEDTERPGSSGIPLPGTRVAIVDEHGDEVPAGTVGEIVADGPHVMPGYWRNPEVTAKAFRVDPRTGRTRLHTGDYGSVDADGYLYFEGRRDDMFKRKGIRMSTLEIEAAAMDIPGVRAAAALAPTADHDLALFVEADLQPAIVLRELSKRLEAQKIPSICRVLEEFPLTLHGKNSRAALVSLLEGSAK
ncbi:AMP-binding protein [Kutzneria buriramensis]|uniref:Amino acid adenylation domain-containing protein n=1 Tax=Kutzneria buriramensis TaxID=1045776 RepID=A0A3E0I623_9PSEU|nr:AMP-binding protein [Kutzneria buriramensis]REH53976.1 amino acid adenylation domain-containing protein [Kutzneria buriramensis]